MMSGHRRTVVILNDFGAVNGGAAKVAIESALGLARRGHRVVYFCAVAPVDERLRATGVESICLDQHASLEDPSRLQGAVRNLWNVRAARRLSGVLAEKGRADTVIHIHGWSKALSPSALWAARRSGLPTVVTIHDYFLACPNGALFDYPLNANCALRPMSAACMTRHCDKQSYAMKSFRVLRQIIQNRAVRGAPWHFAAVSEFALAKIAPFLAAPSRSVLANPIDLSQRPPAEPAGSNLYLAAGRLDPEKGMELFAAAARRAGVRCAVIGTGACEKSIRAANPDVEMLGWMDHPHLMAKLGEARALVFPSLWPETLGLVPLEAASQGVPSVVSDNTAARDWVVDGQTGLHFPSGDVEALAGRLRRLEDDALVARLGRAAYDAYWRAAPTLEKHVDELEKLYRSLPTGHAGNL